MKRLNRKQILYLHTQQIEIFGGSKGIRDENMLDLSINSAYQTFDGVNLYPDAISQSVHLGYSLVMNHPFIDGNKRIGTHAMLTNLYINGYSLTYTDQELIDVILKLASSKLSEKELLEWVKIHINITKA